LKKLSLLFLISLFFVSCNLKDFDLETVPEDFSIKKTHEGVIVNIIDEAIWRSIEGLMITWDKSVKVNPETITNLWFVYGSQQDIEKLKGLKGHRVKVVYTYEDDTSTDVGGKERYVTIIRIVKVEDLETKRDREQSRFFTCPALNLFWCRVCLFMI